MMRVIGVRFREVGNICYYDPDDFDIEVAKRDTISQVCYI